MDEPIYAGDPAAAADTEFVPGRLEHLVPGNGGRLLDERRTPVRVESIDETTGQFAVEVLGFEDTGARWELPFEDVRRFQFARDARLAPAHTAERLGVIAQRMGRPLVVVGHGQEGLERLAAERSWASDALDAAGVPCSLDAAPAIAARTGDPGLIDAVRTILAGRDLADMDEAFATRYASNPASGELVKGHALVAAELGLTDYRGTAVRDRRLFAEPWTRARRAEHLIARMALTCELWRRAGAGIRVHRAVRDDRADNAPFFSTTLSPAVAMAHQAARVVTEPLPTDRLVMTFWETEALNRVYREAEAIVLRSPRPSPSPGG